MKVSEAVALLRAASAEELPNAALLRASTRAARVLSCWAARERVPEHTAAPVLLDAARQLHDVVLRAESLRAHTVASSPLADARAALHDLRSFFLDDDDDEDDEDGGSAYDDADSRNMADRAHGANGQHNKDDDDNNSRPRHRRLSSSSVGVVGNARMRSVVCNELGGDAVDRWRCKMDGPAAVLRARRQPAADVASCERQASTHLRLLFVGVLVVVVACMVGVTAAGVVQHAQTRRSMRLNAYDDLMRVGVLAANTLYTTALRTSVSVTLDKTTVLRDLLSDLNLLYAVDGVAPPKTTVTSGDEDEDNETANAVDTNSNTTTTTAYATATKKTQGVTPHSSVATSATVYYDAKLPLYEFRAATRDTLRDGTVNTVLTPRVYGRLCRHESTFLADEADDVGSTTHGVYSLLTALQCDDDATPDGVFAHAMTNTLSHKANMSTYRGSTAFHYLTQLAGYDAAMALTVDHASVQELMAPSANKFGLHDVVPMQYGAWVGDALGWLVLLLCATAVVLMVMLEAATLLLRRRRREHELLLLLLEDKRVGGSCAADAAATSAQLRRRCRAYRNGCGGGSGAAASTSPLRLFVVLTLPVCVLVVVSTLLAMYIVELYANNDLVASARDTRTLLARVVASALVSPTMAKYKATDAFGAALLQQLPSIGFVLQLISSPTQPHAAVTVRVVPETMTSVAAAIAARREAASAYVLHSAVRGGYVFAYTTLPMTTTSASSAPGAAAAVADKDKVDEAKSVQTCYFAVAPSPPTMHITGVAGIVVAGAVVALTFVQLYVTRSPLSRVLGYGTGAVLLRRVLSMHARHMRLVLYATLAVVLLAASVALSVHYMNLVTHAQEEMSRAVMSVLTAMERTYEIAAVTLTSRELASTLEATHYSNSAGDVNGTLMSTYVDYCYPGTSDWVLKYAAAQAGLGNLFTVLTQSLSFMTPLVNTTTQRLTPGNYNQRMIAAAGLDTQRAVAIERYPDVYTASEYGYVVLWSSVCTCVALLAFVVASWEWLYAWLWRHYAEDEQHKHDAAEQQQQPSSGARHRTWTVLLRAGAVAVVLLVLLAAALVIQTGVATMQGRRQLHRYAESEVSMLLSTYVTQLTNVLLSRNKAMLARDAVPSTTAAQSPVEVLQAGGDTFTVAEVQASIANVSASVQRSTGVYTRWYLLSANDDDANDEAAAAAAVQGEDGGDVTASPQTSRPESGGGSGRRRVRVVRSWYDVSKEQQQKRSGGGGGGGEDAAQAAVDVAVAAALDPPPEPEFDIVNVTTFLLPVCGTMPARVVDARFAALYNDDGGDDADVQLVYCVQELLNVTKYTQVKLRDGESGTTSTTTQQQQQQQEGEGDVDANRQAHLPSDVYKGKEPQWLIMLAQQQDSVVLTPLAAMESAMWSIGVAVALVVLVFALLLAWWVMYAAWQERFSLFASADMALLAHPLLLHVNRLDDFVPRRRRLWWVAATLLLSCVLLATLSPVLSSTSTMTRTIMQSQALQTQLGVCNGAFERIAQMLHYFSYVSLGEAVRQRVMDYVASMPLAPVVDDVNDDGTVGDMGGDATTPPPSSSNNNNTTTTGGVDDVVTAPYGFILPSIRQATYDAVDTATRSLSQYTNMSSMSMATLLPTGLDSFFTYRAELYERYIVQQATYVGAVDKLLHLLPTLVQNNAEPPATDDVLGLIDALVMLRDNLLAVYTLDHMAVNTNIDFSYSGTANDLWFLRLRYPDYVPLLLTHATTAHAELQQWVREMLTLVYNTATALFDTSVLLDTFLHQVSDMVNFNDAVAIANARATLWDAVDGVSHEYNFASNTSAVSLFNRELRSYETTLTNLTSTLDAHSTTEVTFRFSRDLASSVQTQRSLSEERVMFAYERSLTEEQALDTANGVLASAMVLYVLLVVAMCVCYAAMLYSVRGAQELLLRRQQQQELLTQTMSHVDDKSHGGDVAPPAPRRGSTTKSSSSSTSLADAAARQFEQQSQQQRLPPQLRPSRWTRRTALLLAVVALLALVPLTCGVWLTQRARHEVADAVDVSSLAANLVIALNAFESAVRDFDTAQLTALQTRSSQPIMDAWTNVAVQTHRVVFAARARMRGDPVMRACMPDARRKAAAAAAAASNNTTTGNCDHLTAQLQAFQKKVNMLLTSVREELNIYLQAKVSVVQPTLSEMRTAYSMRVLHDLTSSDVYNMLLPMGVSQDGSPLTSIYSKLRNAMATQLSSRGAGDEATATTTASSRSAQMTKQLQPFIDAVAMLFDASGADMYMWHTILAAQRKHGSVQALRYSNFVDVISPTALAQLRELANKILTPTKASATTGEGEEGEGEEGEEGGGDGDGDDDTNIDEELAQITAYYAPTLAIVSTRDQIRAIFTYPDNVPTPAKQDDLLAAYLAAATYAGTADATTTLASFREIFAYNRRLLQFATPPHNLPPLLDLVDQAVAAAFALLTKDTTPSTFRYDVAPGSTNPLVWFSMVTPTCTNRGVHVSSDTSSALVWCGVASFALALLAAVVAALSAHVIS